MANGIFAGTITNSGGAITPFSGEVIIIEAPILDGIDISPPSGPAGTLFTLTVTAHDPNAPPLTPLVYTLTVNAVPATPTATPGQFTWQS